MRTHMEQLLNTEKRWLNDLLYCYECSMIGSLTIAIGFYTVMWGQIKEREMVMDNGYGSLESASLLKTNSSDDT